MTDRIDPGPGWRLLKAREVRRITDETYFCGEWEATVLDGFPINRNSPPTRRRTTPRTTKAIATRATVRASFPDGAMISDSIACKSGLSGEMMQFSADRWELSKIHLQTSGAKYIMLEIQREGEP